MTPSGKIISLFMRLKVLDLDICFATPEFAKFKVQQRKRIFST